MEEVDDIRFADEVLQRIAEGARTYDMEEVWKAWASKRWRGLKRYSIGDQLGWTCQTTQAA